MWLQFHSTPKQETTNGLDIAGTHTELKECIALLKGDSTFSDEKKYAEPGKIIDFVIWEFTMKNYLGSAQVNYVACISGTEALSPGLKNKHPGIGHFIGSFQMTGSSDLVEELNLEFTSLYGETGLGYFQTRQSQCDQVIAHPRASPYERLEMAHTAIVLEAAKGPKKNRERLLDYDKKYRDAEKDWRNMSIAERVLQHTREDIDAIQKAYKRLQRFMSPK